MKEMSGVFAHQSQGNLWQYTLECIYLVRIEARPVDIIIEESALLRVGGIFVGPNARRFHVFFERD